MLKNILKLEGVQQLTRNEQQNVIGAKKQGDFPCYCNGSFAGSCSSVQCCLSLCGM